MTDTTIHLEVESRTVTGKAVKHLRQSGQVPAVIHDHGKSSILVQGPYMVMRSAYQKAGKHHPISLKAGSRTYTALIKSVTFEPRKNQLTHIVFNAVTKNQKVEAEVPVRIRYAEGNEASPAERAGLIVLTQLDAVEVKAVPDKIPDVLEYDGEKLIEEGDQIMVDDLLVPAGVEIMSSNQPLATVFAPAALAAANDDAGGTADEGSNETIEVSNESAAATQAPASADES